MSFWAYMLHCRGGYFYTGHTDDLELRIAQHNSGLLPGFASDHLPVALIQGNWLRLSNLAKSKDSPSTSSGRTDGGISLTPEGDDRCS